MPMPTYQLGLTEGGMASLESLGIPLPQATPVDYSVYLDLGDGSQRGSGWLTCEWRWATISLTEAALVRGYSGACFVQTLEQDGTYGRYSATMIQPGRLPPKVDQVLDFYVVFRAMVAL